MAREHIIAIMQYFQTAFPGFYKDSNPRDVLNVWCDIFESEDPAILKTAAKNYVSSRKFPPTIAEMKEQIDLIKNTKTDADLWALIYKAASNGTYNSDEEFRKLPPECQAFVGGPAALRDLAQIDPGTLNTVVKGQFLKRVQEIREHRNVQIGLPAEVRQAIAESKQRLLEGGTQ